MKFGRHDIYTAVCAAGLVLLSAGLRLPRLDERPMHADEAVLADKFGELLAGRSYPYNPREFHGPALGYCTLIPAVMTGQASYASLHETTLRVVPAVAGILLAVFPLLLAPALGRGAALAASAILAAAPPAVYYSRFYIPETLLALGTAALITAVWRAIERPHPARWAICGALAGFMLATKETAVLALLACAAGLWIAYRPRIRANEAVKPAAAFSVALVVVVSAMLAPPWKWDALAPAVPAYFARAVNPGPHAHAWYSYFGLIWWVLPPAAIGLLAGWRGKRPFARFAGLFSVLVAVIYCILPYKTPWCVLTMLYGLALLAGMGIDVLGRRRPAAAAALLTAGVAALGWQAWVQSTKDSANPGNPLAYAQTGRGVFTIRDRIREITQASQEGARTGIAVYTRQNWWPLPWYFRDYPNIRWWREAPLQGKVAPVVLVSPELEPQVTRKIYEGPPPGERELYVNLFAGYTELRPGVEVRGYAAKSLWDRWQIRGEVGRTGVFSRKD